MNANNEILVNFSFLGRAWTLPFSFGRLWCTWTHNSPMWPMKGRYQCARCLRYYPVLWEKAESNVHSAKGIYGAVKRLGYTGPMPKALSRSDLVRILSRATAIEGDGVVEQPTTRLQLACGHEDEVRLGIDPNQVLCASCRANGVRLRGRAA